MNIAKIADWENVPGRTIACYVHFPAEMRLNVPVVWDYYNGCGEDGLIKEILFAIPHEFIHHWLCTEESTAASEKFDNIEFCRVCGVMELYPKLPAKKDHKLEELNYKNRKGDIKIISDGTICGTKVYANNKKLDTVSSIDLHIGVGRGVVLKLKVVE